MIKFQLSNEKRDKMENWNKEEEELLRELYSDRSVSNDQLTSTDLPRFSGH
jgi:hypothetical protein